MMLSFAGKREDIQKISGCSMVELIIRSPSTGDGYLVIIVFVEAVKVFDKELLCSIAQEDRTEETLDACSVLLHQTVIVDVQVVKDNLQDLDNLHVVELLNGTFSISVCIQIGREEGVPPETGPPLHTGEPMRAPKNRIKGPRHLGQKICCQLIQQRTWGSSMNFFRHFIHHLGLARVAVDTFY